MNMKRILSVTAALLLLMLALAGCGSDSQETAEEPAEAVEAVEETEAQPAEETEPAQETEQAAETSAEAAGLSALADRMISEAGITDAIPVSAQVLANVYGLDAAQIADAAGYNASASGAFPQEIILVKAVDADAAAAVAQAFANRLADIAAQAESYDPDSLALAQRCAVVTKGDYVGLFFSEHYDRLADLFQSGVE